VFADWLPGWRFAQQFDIATANGARKDDVFRHDGKVNVVFVDGHIGQFSWPFPTDINAAPWN
jgi:prepilin-type processing-associated H-X9-DG protein